jgi:subtilisin family serine protease
MNMKRLVFLILAILLPVVMIESREEAQKGNNWIHNNHQNSNRLDVHNHNLTSEYHIRIINPYYRHNHTFSAARSNAANIIHIYRQYNPLITHIHKAKLLHNTSTDKPATSTSSNNNSPYLIKVRLPNTEHQVTKLNWTLLWRSGYCIHNYIPHSNYLVLPLVHHNPNVSALLNLINSNLGILSISQYQASNKIDQHLLDNLKNSVNKSFSVGIALWSEPYYSSIGNIEAHWNIPASVLVNVHSATLVELFIPNTFHWRQVYSIIWRIANRPETEYIYPESDFEVSNYHAHSLIQSGLFSTLSVPNHNELVLPSTPLWDMGIRGNGQIVTTGDTGLAYNHCLFKDPQHPAPIDEISYDHRKLVMYINTRNKSYDNVAGHGTHTAASIAGSILPELITNETSLYKPLSLYNGVAPAAKLVIFDFNDGKTKTKIKTPKDIYSKYYQIAYDAGARISSNAWGARNGSQLKESRDTDRFVYDTADFLPIFAAGNYGRNGLQSVVAPGTAKNSLCIGATRSSMLSRDQSGAIDVCGSEKASDNPEIHRFLTIFSGRGPTYDFRIKPELVTAGEFVVSARSNGEPNVENCASCPDALHALFGTSMSTGIASGAAALTRQYYTDGFYPTGAAVVRNKFLPSAALLKATLIHSAIPDIVDPYYDADIFLNDTYSPSVKYGFGRIQLNTVLKDPSAPYNLYVVDRKPISTLELHHYCFALAKHVNYLFRATLVYSDPPALMSAKWLLINNLDLSISYLDAIKNNTNQVLLGNMQYINDAPIYDITNNVEQITITSQQQLPSSYIAVHVAGHNVPVSPQQYSLVITGNMRLEPDMNKCAGLDSICPNSCSNPQQGKCNSVTGLCDCSAEYTSADCSVQSETMSCNAPVDSIIDMVIIMNSMSVFQLLI